MKRSLSYPKMGELNEGRGMEHEEAEQGGNQARIHPVIPWVSLTPNAEETV